MSEWVKVVTHPLGLAGFALFLAFGSLARAKRTRERRWLATTAMTMAFIALVGGFFLAYNGISKDSSPVGSTQRSQQQTNQVKQSTTGAESPAVQGVQGDVTITVDQSSGKTEGEKIEKKPASGNN